MTCWILVSVLGLSDRGASYMYGNSDLFGKKKNKKIKLISWHLEFFLCVSIQESQWDFTKLIGKGSSMDDLYPVNVSPPSICWVIQPHKNPMIQSQYYWTPKSGFPSPMRQLLHSVVKLPHRKPSQQHLNVSHHTKNHLNIKKVSSQHGLTIIKKWPYLNV